MTISADLLDSDDFDAADYDAETAAHFERLDRARDAAEAEAAARAAAEAEAARSRGAAVVRSLFEPFTSGPPVDYGSRIAALALSRDEVADLPDPESLIDNTLPCRTVALLAGYASTGKSFLALDWSASIATGIPWLGRPTRQGRVLYFAAEGSTGLRYRLDAWEAEHGVQIPDPALTIVPAPIYLADPEALRGLRDYLRTRGPFDLVVVDTVARSAAGLDENSSRDVGAFIAGAYEIVKTLDGGSVLLVHHTGKDRASIRGSSAFEGNPDVVYLTSGDVATRMVLKRLKNKDGEREDVHALRLKVHGKSGALVEITDEDTKASTNLEAAFDALVAAFREAPSFSKAEAVAILMTSTGRGKSVCYERLKELRLAGWIAEDAESRFTFTREG